MLHPLPLLVRFFVISLTLASSLLGQNAPTRVPLTPPPVPVLPKPAYPDSTSGLEHVAKDIVEAQLQNDGSRAEALLKTFVLPHAYDWYDHVFGREAADHAGDYYEKAAASIPPFLARTFLDSRQQNRSKIEAIRYEHSCDDNAPQEAYGILLRRREPVPLYELRFIDGERYLWIFPIAYVDGAFRYLLSPDFRPPASANGTRNSDSDKKPSPQENNPPQPRAAVGGEVQAGKLLKKVQPIYPQKARQEHVSGTVKIHAIIGKEGQISMILGVHGVCSLAEAAVDAVRQWRYAPALLEGRPVEVDTQLDVIFTLSR